MVITTHWRHSMTTMLNAANNAGVSLFNTVARTATSLTKSVDTVMSVIDMAEAFVTKELTKQQLAHKLDLIHHKKTATESSKVMTAETLADLATKLTDPAIAAIYATLTEYDSL